MQLKTFLHFGGIGSLAFQGGPQNLAQTLKPENLPRSLNQKPPQTTTRIPSVRALTMTYAMLGAPYYNYGKIYPKTMFQLLKRPLQYRSLRGTRAQTDTARSCKGPDRTGRIFTSTASAHAIGGPAFSKGCFEGHNNDRQLLGVWGLGFPRTQ